MKKTGGRKSRDTHSHTPFKGTATVGGKVCFSPDNLKIMDLSRVKLCVQKSYPPPPPPHKLVTPQIKGAVGLGM